MSKYIILNEDSTIADIVMAEEPPAGGFEVTDNAIFDPIRNCHYQNMNHADFQLVDGVISLTAAAEQRVLEKIRVDAIKAEARQRIIKHIPGGTAENYLEKENLFHAEYSELQDILLEGGTLTAEQIAYKADLKARFNIMRDIIAMSNDAETNLDLIETYITALDAKGY